jgi:uncharacterized protein
MAKTPAELLKTFVENTQNADVIRDLVAPDATYVSLNQADRDLHRIMPWAGTHDRGGPQGIIDTFARVAKFWHIESFSVDQLFGDSEHAAAFGRFTYTSTVLKKRITSPFAILITAHGDKITYMQFMEDTFATASSFQKDGRATYHSDPDGKAFSIEGAPSIA